MSEYRDYATFRELTIFVFILVIAIAGTSFISWKDTRELQERVGTL